MFTGTLTALITPMQGGQVDQQGLRELVEFQISEGINGLVPCGTTGEATTLSSPERSLVIKTVAEQARGRIPVVAGTGTNDTRAAVENSRLAQEAGADGLLHVTPYYNRPTGDGLWAHFHAIAKATDLPVLVYNVPSRTGCDMTPDVVVRVAEIPRIVGIKEATGSIARIQELVALCPKDFIILSGDDATALAASAVGGQGVISVVSNIVPGPMAKMISAVRAGHLEQARTLHYQLLPLIQQMFVASNPIPIKAAAALLGFTANEVRLPLVPLEGELLAALKAEMVHQGVLS